MKTRPILAALAACMTTAATAYAAAPPASASPEAGVSMAGSGEADKVRYGERVRLAGTVSPRARGRTVRLEHAPRGRGFEAVRSTRTASDGSYRFTAVARRSGAYRAVTGDGAAASGTRRVRVVAAVDGRSNRHVLGGDGVRVRGKLLPALAGRAVRLDLRSRGRWRTVDRTRTGSDGRFRSRWRPQAPGAYSLRVRFVGDGSAARATGRLPRVYAYRSAHASYYGPGLYGGRTACGQTLDAGTVGVAHRSLPCGTRVKFRYRGRSATVPVIDRGPYTAGREWDLTEAAKRRLGFGSTGVVWSTR